MKVIIIGAGIAGLSTYLALRKHLLDDSGDDQQHEILIYEAHDVSRYYLLRTDESEEATKTHTKVSEANTPENEPTFTPEAIGSAIGIAKNGLDVLARLGNNGVDSDSHGGEGMVVDVDIDGPPSRIIHRMLATGHPVSKWKIGSARGWKLIDAEMVPPPSAQQKKGKTGEEDHQKTKAKRSISGVMISRQGMWRILLDEVVRVGGKGVMRRAVVREVLVPPGGQKREGAGLAKAVVVLEDGLREEADLIVGADGLRSVVRAAMFPTSTKTACEEKASWSVLDWLLSWFRTAPPVAKDYITPHYEGLVGVSSFLPSSLLTSTGHERGTMSITFGANGFWGCGFISTSATAVQGPLTLSTADPAPEPGPTAVYWSTFPSAAEPWPYHKHEDGARPKPQDFDRAAALRALLLRHKHWKNPSIQAILKYAEENPDKGVEGFYPTWTTTPLPAWHQGGVVLVGDAAHALQPSSGQGACQALEDAEVLARCLRHFIDRKGTGDQVSVQEACAKYEQVRMPRVKEIYDRSQRMSRMKGDMSWIEEMLMYAVVRVMGMLHDGFNERLVGYDLPAEVEKALQTT